MTDEIEALVERYLNGLSSPDEVRQLDEMAQRDPSVCQALLEGAAMDTQLHRLLATAGDAPMRAPDVATTKARSTRWLRPLGYAAAALVAIAGWIAAVVVNRERIALQTDLATAHRQIAEATTQPKPDVTDETPDPDAGEVIESRGLVLAIPDGKGAPLSVTVGAEVSSGQSLWTCPWGSAAIRYADHSSVQMDRSTMVALSENNGQRRIAIKEGILYLAKDGETDGGPLVVTTDRATVRLAKGQAAVAASAEQTIVESSIGHIEVTVTGQDRRFDVAAGHYLRIHADGNAELVRGRLMWSLQPAN